MRGKVGEAKMDREKLIKDNAIRGLQSAIEISGALVHLRKEHAKAILALLKEHDELLKHEYWRGYNNGRADERGLQEGTIMQTFSPD